MNILGTKLGTKLELELVNSLGQKIGQTYISQLIDIINETTIIIAAPIHESRLMFISPGTKIRVIFIHDKYGLVFFYGTITQKENTDNLITFHTKLDSNLEKIQRRNFYRLDCLVNGSYRQYEEKEAHEDNKLNSTNEANNYKKAIVKNISGNGACIVTTEEVPKGSYVELIILFDKSTSVKSVCKVMRVSRIDNNIKEKKFELGLYFSKISQKDQDYVVKYIFDQQRSQLKNSLNNK